MALNDIESIDQDNTLHNYYGIQQLRKLSSNF